MPPVGYPERFRSNGFVTFPRELTEQDAAWWERAIYQRIGVYPDGVVQFLGSGIPARVTGEYTRFDAGAATFELSLRAYDGQNVEIAFKHKRFEVGGGLINSGETRVTPDWQEYGIGTRLMINLIDFAEGIQARRIDIEAQDIGRYVWLKMGFLPDRTSWTDRIAPKVRRFAELAAARGDIDRHTYASAIDISTKSDPRFARELLALKGDVPGLDRRGEPAAIPLPKAIMLQSGTDWNGSFELDEDTMGFFNAFKGAHHVKLPHPK